ncbi:hypothetical protein ABID39_000279 [Bartonella japonica]|uniref:Uncharacterized protein n=1 Tax=Bartonella japonica TaxID=357761 RepID=A0ABV2FM14_9HYPH
MIQNSGMMYLLVVMFTLLRRKMTVLYEAILQWEKFNEESTLDFIVVPVGRVSLFLKKEKCDERIIECYKFLFCIKINHWFQKLLYTCLLGIGFNAF